MRSSKEGNWWITIGFISKQQINEIQPLFTEHTNDPDTSDSIKQLMQSAVTILNGSCDPAPTDDSAPYYDDAAEILFLIEGLGE